MKKILISWLAVQNDFVRTEAGMNVNLSGPNYLYHQHFFDVDKHILLSSAADADSDTASLFLLNALRKDFPTHPVELVYMDIRDVIDLNEVYQKVLPILLQWRDYKIDVFFSPGTAVMRLVWFMLHQSMGLQTTLIQTRKPEFDKKKLPERVYMEIQRDDAPSSLIIRQINNLRQLQQLPIPKNFCITDCLKKVYEQAHKVAQTNVTTLILGESGTGKEHLARYIHDQSVRKDLPFVPVNCSALGDNLLESRLFGHKKGSFTGAYEEHIGLFEQSNGGTIFLDEIGDVSLYMQQLLLRVLQENEIQPIGKKSKKINVRIIAATNKDLVECCEAGTFRWDLYYRLAIIDLEIPAFRQFPLEERKKLLVFFLKHFSKLYQKDLVLEPELEARLLAYPFPGNIRELENLIERFFVLGQEKVGVSSLPERIRKPKSSFSPKLADAEALHIQKVLELHDFKLGTTAEALGIALNTLKKKLKNN